MDNKPREMKWAGTWSSVKPGAEGMVHVRVFTEYVVEGRTEHIVLLDGEVPAEEMQTVFEIVADAYATAESTVRDRIERAFHKSLGGIDPRTTPPTAEEVLEKHGLAA